MQIGHKEILIMGGKEGSGICRKDVYLLDIANESLEKQESLDLPWFSIYAPVYKGDTVYIQNSGTELDGVPDPMLYLFPKIY